MNRQEIAQDAHAAFGRLAALRDHCGGRVAFGNCGEDFQFNRSLDRFGQLMRVDRVEEAFRSGLLLQRCGGHEFLLSSEPAADGPPQGQSFACRQRFVCLAQGLTAPKLV